MKHLIYKEEAYLIIGKCMEVHRILGPGFLEAVYKDALEYEFQKEQIPYSREACFEIPYKESILRQKYYADFTVYHKIILEAKAIDMISDAHTSCALNYLKVSHFHLCLLVNFGSQNLEYKRIVL